MSFRTRFDTLESVEWALGPAIAIAVSIVVLLLILLVRAVFGSAPFEQLERVPPAIAMTAIYACAMIVFDWRRVRQQPRTLVVHAIGGAALALTAHLLDTAFGSSSPR